MFDFQVPAWLTGYSLKLWAIAKILIFFFVVRFIAYRLIDRVLRSLCERQGPTPVTTGRIKTLGSLAKSTIFYVLIFIAGIMVLKIFEVDTAPVLTAAGVLGLAIGFGAQKLVRDIISGFFIVLEDQYSVGEYVTIGAATGTIEELGMRVTRLRDDVGKLVIVSNGDITLVTNHSRGPIQIALDISIAAESNLAKVRDLIDNIGAGISSGVEGVVTAPRADGVTAFDGGKVTIRIVGEVQPGRQEAVQAALREELLAGFSSEEIKVV